MEEYLEVLYAQFNMQTMNNGFSFSESDRMAIDEFELLIQLFNERQKEIQKLESM